MQGGLALGIGREGHCLVELAVIVDAEFYSGAFHRISVAVNHCHDVVAGLHIVAYDIDFRECLCSADDILRSVIVSVHEGVHKEGPGGRLVEPGHVELGFRLAGSEE